MQIEAQGDGTTKCHLCPTEYAYDDAEHHSVIFIGIKRIIQSVHGLAVTVPYSVDSSIVKNEIAERKKPGMDAVVSQFRRNRMPDSVCKLVSGSSGA
jgi:hypothetical protein